MLRNLGVYSVTLNVSGVINYGGDIGRLYRQLGP